MKRSQNLILAVVAAAICAQAEAQKTVKDASPVKVASETKVTSSLEDQLKSLDAENAAPAAVSREKLYAVQARYMPLRFKSEFSLGGGYNLTGDSFLTTQQVEVGYRFHFNDRWSVGVHEAWVNNEFKSEANNLRTANGAVPNVPYAITRTDLLAEFNLFYGKFRLGTDTVFYFDQYLALGPGLVQQNTGTVGAGVGDIGLAFWLGKWASTRIGLKEYYYNEAYPSGTQASSNMHAHLDVGVLF